MPKDTSDISTPPPSTPYVKPKRTPPVKAFRMATCKFLSRRSITTPNGDVAQRFFVTPAQFTFIRHQKPEYVKHRGNPEARKICLDALWATFLERYPEHDIPPFPEEADMVKRFHETRALVR